MTDQPSSLAAAFPDGEFDPCPLDQECGNCGHPMRGHFRELQKGFATGCHRCRCEHWWCRHGGQRSEVPLISVEEL